MNLKKYILILFFSFSFLSENENKGFSYLETALPKTNRINPYYKLKIQDYDKRFFALIHETIYEKSAKPFANFIKDENQILSINCDNTTTEDICNYILEMPGVSDPKWKFHNDVSINASDLVYSLKYAIKIGLLDPRIFNFDNTIVDLNGNVQIGLNIRLDNLSLKHYLTKVSVIPSETFSSYIDGNSKYRKDSKIKEFNQNPIGAGPFKLKYHDKMKSNQILTTFMGYKNTPKIEQISVKQSSIKAEHINLLEKNTVDLIIDVPFPYGKEIEEPLLMEELLNNSAYMLFINHKNSHLENRKFRQAMAYLINKRALKKDIFGGKCEILKSPVNSSDAGYNDNQIEGYKYSEKKFKKLLEEAGYTITKKPRPLVTLNGEAVELVLGYNADISDTEVDALRAIEKVFDNMGLEIILKDINSATWDKYKFSPQKWDLIYDKVSLQDGESLDRYYSKKGSFNRKATKYYSKQAEELMKEEKRNALDPTKKSSSRQALMRLLNQDVASLYLWNLSTYYLYDNRILDDGNSNFVNSYNFFSEPHRWRLSY